MTHQSQDIQVKIYEQLYIKHTNEQSLSLKFSTATINDVMNCKLKSKTETLYSEVFNNLENQKTCMKQFQNLNCNKKMCLLLVLDN